MFISLLRNNDRTLVVYGDKISQTRKQRDRIGFTTTLRTSRNNVNFLNKSSPLFIAKYICDHFAPITRNEKEQMKLKAFISIVQVLIDPKGDRSLTPMPTDMMEDELLLVYNVIFQYVSDASDTELSQLAEARQWNGHLKSLISVRGRRPN